jgi:hypothetical protein
MSALPADIRSRGGEGPLKPDLTRQSMGSRTAGSGAIEPLPAARLSAY